MVTTLDRQLARAFVALAAVVVAAAVLTGETPSSPRVVVRDDPYAYARLVVLAQRADSASLVTDFEFRRTRGERTDRSTFRLARTPEGSVEWSATNAVLRDGGRTWSCFEVDEAWTCPETTTTDPPRSLGPATLFFAAAASGDYRFEHAASEVIASAPSECFFVVLTGIEPLAEVGNRVKACFNAEGALTFFRRENSGGIDEQVAQRIAPITDRELDDFFRDASRGLVSR